MHELDLHSARADRAAGEELAGADGDDRATRPVLSVVTPVFNGASFIGENSAEIFDALGRAEVPYEVIVVSDGSVDATAGEMLGRRHATLRFMHYERNMGKGYAVKLGMLAARGDYIGFIDSDLDLRPEELIRYLGRIRSGNLDAIIGSKRHAESTVDYPARRRAYSWLYQKLIRALFGLDVRDTQVGIKLFRRELVDEVVPHLLVKRYAFDLELLAVASSFGYGHIEEAPIRLDYQFTGSGMSIRAISQALWDTAAVFYRVRLLRYYAKRRRLLSDMAPRAATTDRVAVAVLVSDEPAQHAQADRTIEALEHGERRPDEVVSASSRGAAIEATNSSLIAFLEPGTIPAFNWLSALLPFMADDRTVAVGGPVIPATTGHIADDVTASLYESRFGAGPVSRRHVPGNLRETSDVSPRNLLMRRAAAEKLVEHLERGDGAHIGESSQILARIGRQLYAPDAAVVAAMPRFGRRFFESLYRHGRARGRRIRGGHRTPGFVFIPALFVAAIITGAALGAMLSTAWYAEVAVITAYLLGLAYAAAHGALRRGSIRVGLGLLALVPLSHVTYGMGVIGGIVCPLTGAASSTTTSRKASAT